MSTAMAPATQVMNGAQASAWGFAPCMDGTEPRPHTFQGCVNMVLSGRALRLHNLDLGNCPLKRKSGATANYPTQAKSGLSGSPTILIQAVALLPVMSRTISVRTIAPKIATMMV